jgi:hypothetical protein
MIIKAKASFVGREICKLQVDYLTQLSFRSTTKQMIYMYLMNVNQYYLNNFIALPLNC